MNWAITFKQAGARNIYMRIDDNSDQDSGWVQRGPTTLPPASAPWL